MWQGPEHSSARLERFLQMTDEHPYKVPEVDESKWFTGGHLGGQIQKINWQVGLSTGRWGCQLQSTPITALTVMHCSMDATITSRITACMCNS